MMIHIFASGGKSGLKLDPKTAKLVQVLPLSAIGKHKPPPGDLCYADISGLGDKEISKLVNSLKRRCGTIPWGIIDPKGVVEDPAELFFNGMSDYIGRKLCISGIDGKRFGSVVTYFSGACTEAAKEKTANPESKKIKLPSNKFPGWDSIRAGEVCPFFFLYAAFEGTSNLRSRLGENGFNLLKTRLRSLLQQNLDKADPLLWIETETDFLFLLPPKAQNVRVAVTACLKMNMSTPLVISEKLGLINIPGDFRFALHYGKTAFKAPGKTGTIISEAVNFIFHLGTKFSRPGRLAISDEVPGEAIPEQLRDMFTAAGCFEDHGVIHSKMFTHSAGE